MEQIPDTLDSPPKQFNVQKISYTYATIHVSHDLFDALHNPAPAIPLVKLGNTHKEALISLVEIFGKAPPPELPTRVQVSGAYQEKLQQVNQERTQMKNVSQSKPFINAEPLRVSIVETYPRN